MRDANYRLPLEGTASSPVLYGVARCLEDLFPVVEQLRFLDSVEDGSDIAPRDTDEDEPSKR
jgi:hypothetical protein